MKPILFSILVALTACGGGGKKTDTKPTGGSDSATPTETMSKTQPPPEEAKPAPPPEEPKPDPEAMKKEAMDKEMAAFEKAKPVFEGACKACHQAKQKSADKKKLAAFEITTYPFKGKMSSTAEIRRVLGLGDDKKATMPKTKPGSVKGDDLEAIKAWADAYDAAESAGAHPAKAEEPAKKP